MVFIDDELLRLGLQTLLPTISLPINARYPGDARELYRALELSRADVLLATPDSLADIDLAANSQDKPVPRTLLLIDEHEIAVGFDIAATP
ncbi:hypothetical protein AB0395_40610, partial [Streptosporangium sp. NPDC051023]|uniref:hypothetical protein n=1 Tax=Streptosporangium sp. NPDC051023 TaxID=3155410 RepID=UPI00344F9043